jgi:hypothetical protein
MSFLYQIISKAFTNEVQNIGSIRVTHSHLISMAQTNATEDARKTIHHIAVFFFLVFSMSKNFGKNKG